MLREILAIGDKIEIKPLGKTGKPIHNARSFVSQLIDFVDFDVIHIATPIVFGRTLLLVAGENYNLCFYTSKGLYQCNCVAMSNHKENNTVISVVRITTNLEKFQRRQYYRLECIIDVDFRLISTEELIIKHKLQDGEIRSTQELEEWKEKLELLDQNWSQAAVTNISGGGCRFNSNILLSQNDKVKLKFNLVIGNELKKLVFGAVVISSDRLINREGTYENRVEFYDIIQKDREDLIKYIFEQERKRRKSSNS